MPPERLIVSLVRCMSTIVDATYKFTLPLRLVMRIVFMLSLMTQEQHGRPSFVPSESSHRGPNRAPTLVAPSAPVPQDEGTPSVPETPRFDPAKGDPSPDDPAVGVATKIEAKDRVTQTPPLVSRLIQGYLENTGMDACPLYQMDHGVTGAWPTLPSQNQGQPTPTRVHLRRTHAG